MNHLWPIIIIISYVFALISGNMSKVNEAIFNSLTDVIQLSMTLLGNMCLWCGIMNIIKTTSIMDILRKILKPFLLFLYPENKNDEEIMNNASINMISNMLGIGNAATPAGLKAIEEMHKNNKDKSKITNSMGMLIVLNTTSIQIIPTTVIALMMSLGDKNPTKIIAPIWISTFAGTIVAIMISKIIFKSKGSKK